MGGRRGAVVSGWIGVLWLYALAGCADSASDKEINFKNQSFHVWCGDHACAWEVAQGTVSRAPTWHRSATGLGMDGDPCEVFQVTPEVPVLGCVSMAILSDIRGDAALSIAFDVGNDGLDARDAEFPIADMDWQEVTLDASVGGGPLRIVIRKTGTGQAVLAFVDVWLSDEC